MPHDQNGIELKPGDVVTMEFEVQQVYPDAAEACNVNLQAIGGPEGGYAPNITCNTRLTKLARRVAVMVGLLLLTISGTAMAAGPLREYRATGYWEWTATNCGHVWKWHAYPKAATSTSTSQSSVTTTDNSVQYIYNIVYEQGTAAQGSTIYGGYDAFSRYELRDTGDLLFQQQQLAGSIAQLAARATAQVNDSIDRKGEQDSAVARILAAGQANSAVATAATAGGPTVKTYNFHAGESGDLVQSQGGQSAGDLAGLVQQKCSGCHNAQKQSGGIDLSDLSALSDEHWHRALDAVAKGRMPKSADGQPQPLSPAEKLLFFEAER